MKNNTKKVGLVVIILLVLVILFIGVTKNMKRDIKNDSLPQEEVLVVKENLKDSGIYSFDRTSSKIGWEGSKTFIKEWRDTGNISVQSGEITLVDGNITKGKITIDMNSINAQKTGSGGGEDGLSKHLKSADFFNVETFPTSQFSLTSITPSEEKYTYNVKGDITIKNITKTIEFPMIIYMANGSIFMDAEITLDRTLFDIKFGSSNFIKDIGNNAINDNFTLKLNLVANKL